MFKFLRRRKPKKVSDAAVFFVVIVIVLEMLTVGMITPVLPKLIAIFQQGNVSLAAKTIGLFGTTWGIMHLVFSPILGGLSDRYGRRPILLMSIFTLGLDYFLMAMAPTLNWLFVGRIISGATSASLGAAGAYIADVTSHEQRAQKFGLLGGAWGIGFVIGPALGGLLGSHDLRLPFWIAAILSLLGGSIGLFILPESLPKTARNRFSWRRANPFGSIMHFRTRPSFLKLALAYFLSHMPYYVFASVFVLYVGSQFNWTEQQVGVTLSASGICVMFVQLVLVRPTVARFGERNAALIGVLCGALGWAIGGLAKTGLQFLINVPFLALFGISLPALMAMMSRRASTLEQGRLQGTQSSLQGAAGLVAPMLFSQTFAFFVSIERSTQIPGAPFFLASAILLCCFATILTVPREKDFKSSHIV